MEEASVCDAHEVLLEVDIDNALTVDDPLGIFSLLLRPRLIDCLILLFLLLFWFVVKLLYLFFAFFRAALY